LFAVVIVVDVVAATLAVGQAVRSHNTLLAVLQQQERRQWRWSAAAAATAAKDVAHACWRTGQDHSAAVVEHRGIRGRRTPTSTAAATAATTTATVHQSAAYDVI